MRNRDWIEIFVFSRKERLGIVVLLLMVIFAAVFPFFLDNPENPIDAETRKAFEKDIAKLEAMQHAADSMGRAGYNTHASTEDEDSLLGQPAAGLFYFDPNTLSEAGWKKLGLRGKTIQTIQHYLSKGGKFRKPEDLSRVYGLKKTEFQRLLPYVRIAQEERSVTEGSHDEQIRKEYNPQKHSLPAKIEINSADSAAWEALPGIGSKLAMRIINFRERLGGFYSVEQVAETYGLPDSTFHLVRDRLACNQSGIRLLSVNNSTEAELSRHPYIKFKLARLIVRFREMHGPYHSATDLQQIDGLSPETLQKILPYLLFE